MPQKKHSTKQHRKSRFLAHKLSRRTKWIVFTCVALFIACIVGIIFWRAALYNNNTTKLVATVSEPAPATFTDSNNMLFYGNATIPDVNNSREIAHPQSVIVSYSPESGPYAPAFKINLTNSELAENVKITPFVRGQWFTRGDSSFVFEPDTEWPAGTKFTIKISPEIFNDDVRPNTTRVSFKTPDITATVDNFNLYTAPDDKKSVIGIAVISFNYEIDTANFDDKVSLKLDGKKLDFSVRFDKFHRTAFIISAPVQITDTAQTIRMKLNRVSSMAGDSRTEKITAHTTIESGDNIFKISSLDTIIANNNDGNVNQLILLNTTTAAANNTDWSKYIHAYILPKYRTPDEEESETIHVWKNDEITESVLTASTVLDLTPMNFTSPNGVYQYAFSYNVSEKSDRYIYVSLDSGMVSANGFIMKDGISSVMLVPYPSASVEIAGSGALLSLSGDRELGIVAHGGVDTAYVNLYKIKSDEINHLISQTYDVFSKNMEFKSWSFGVYDMSTVFQKRISFANPSMTRPSYASINLGDYLDRTYGDNTGIFVLQTGTSENATDYNDKRLILLTNLGIIRKVNLDESSSVFISNLDSGTPAPDVEISVLGRNGGAIWAGRTDENGHTDIPQLPWSEYRNAREPVAIVARRGNDVSFIPYNSYAQRVEYSKFNIDGVYSGTTTPLNAFLFSDRGIYRPGESIIIGGIVKNKSFKSLSGIPVKLEMRDMRGRLMLEKTFSLTPDGMFDIKYEIPTDATLGNWAAYLYSLNARNQPMDTLGTMNFDVQEFVPDTMKISATIAGATDNGWIAPENISANVSLRNLFGTPAANHRISGHATLTPVKYSFPQLPDYTFSPHFYDTPAISNNTARRIQTISVDIPDTTTNANGMATIDLDFDTNIPHGTYVLNMNIRGFQANSGASVQTNVSTRVSDVKYLVGYKTSSDLTYLSKASKHHINLIAVDHTANQIGADGLTMRLMRRENQTTLVKDYNNYYKYQTISNDKIISQTKIDIPETGIDINLDTENGGTYFLQILDASDTVLTSLEYFVAGTENTSLTTDTNAELQIKLDKSEYAPGDEIAVNITAPYIGAGLITIERDQVYAYKWFNATSTTSVQHITVPDNFSGTGYVNVSFVRDINSRDIFTNPYTYAVAPFTADTSSHKISIKLDVPEKITNNKLTVHYNADKSARMMIFAINTGILQVAKYQIPNPLAHFFQKSALQVNTYQILSLLLPEYNILREYAKTGGGDYGGDAGALDQITTNPFGRSTLPPVAFYSEILDVRANEPGTVEFEIPEYFNGAIRVFAVAARDNAVGSADTETLIQSPLIISTSAPVAVAPGDSFKINSVITNMTDTDGTASVSVSTTGGLGIDITTKNSDINHGTDHLFTFDANATNLLGNATIQFDAELSDKDSKLATRTNTSTLSVRPTAPFTTDIKFGELDSDNTKIKRFALDMYPEFSTRKLYISRGAAVMARPLYEYLADYDLPCTEQLVSRAIPYVLFPENQILGTTFDTSNEKITDIINKLKNLQNDDGSFNLWSDNDEYTNTSANPDTAYLTAYVAQFLTIANDSGFTVPPDMLSRAINYLRDFAGNTITDDAYASAVAYAIYVISENDYVSTSYIDTFTQYANENIPDWETKLMGAYIATSYSILKQDDLAHRLIAKYAPSRTSKFVYNTMFDNNVANDAMYYYLTAHYFDKYDATKSDALREYINSGDYSAYTSAAVIMALAGNISTTSSKAPTISITTDADQEINTTIIGDAIIAAIPANASELNIHCDNCNDAPVYYTILQQGYPRDSHAQSNGIEIIREYYDANGDQITSGNIGDIITVRISARTRGGVDTIKHVVISDLLPGGFIPTTDSATGDMEFSEMREDRVLIYTDLNRAPREFTYTVQLGTVGTFAIPPISAQSMYNPQQNATGDGGTFTVSDGAEK